MTPPLLSKDITALLGLDELSAEEQATFLANIGDVILETALVRFSSLLSEPQHIALQEYLETSPEPDVLMKHLLDHYEEFKDVLEAVTLEFKEDALAVVGEKVEEGTD